MKTQALKEAAADNTPVSATVTPLNTLAEATEQEQKGELTWTGVLKSVGPPKRDAAASGKTMLKLVFTPNG